MEFLDSKVFHFFFIFYCVIEYLIISISIMISFVMGFLSLCPQVVWCAVSFLGLVGRTRRTLLEFDEWYTVGLPPDTTLTEMLRCTAPFLITSTLGMFILITYASF